jgi:hypothetical protein
MTTKTEGPTPQPTPFMERPPDSDHPTTAQLKADINSGATGDKVGVFDPGLSTLGTDDEAAGTPPSPEAITMARQNEVHARGAAAKQPTSWTPSTRGTLSLILVVVALTFLGGFAVAMLM